MHRDVDSIFCKTLGSGSKWNQGRDSAAFQGSLAVFTSNEGVHAGVFLVIEDI